MLLSKETNSL